MAYDATDFVVTETPAPVRDPKTITDPRERVAYLRDFLRALPPERFNMRDWHCGSAACIGGWCENLFFGGRNTPETKVGAAIGLSWSEAYDLFYPPGRCNSDTTTAQAANVLDHYLSTGMIDWSVA